tara:strand:+ start:3141 stop:3560 length:420 start_codon:yes stop_codon:yes gene_type:complete
MKKIIRLKESDLQHIVKRVLSEQTTGSTESSVGNALSTVKLDNGVEIQQEYIGEYKKVKLEITGPRKEVNDILRKLKVNGCIPIGKAGSSISSGEITKKEIDGEFLGMDTKRTKYQRGEMVRSFTNEYLVPKEFDFKTL